MSIRTEVLMGTFVTVEVFSAGADAAVERAFEWFREIESRCTRFDERSELSELTARIGVPVPVSAILYEAVQFALTVAEESGGAFDPAIGHRMAALGFDKEHRTGHVAPAIVASEHASYRHVRMDSERRTITLERPLLLDLGAVAKGMAVDMAARELRPFSDFAIDAGGDLYLGGRNAQGTPWSVGIRHPRLDGQLIDTLRVSDTAVCTTGDYERLAPGGQGGHHILDPRTGASSGSVASATVVAPTAMLADALATAAFVLGPFDGIRLLERLEVGGLIFTPGLDRYETRGFLR